MSDKANKKPDRMKNRSDFLRLQKNGRRWVSKHVVVETLENEHGHVRFGFTATKKLGNAVVRNRTKRRMRAAAQALAPSISKNVDIVLIGRFDTANCAYTTLLGDLKWCLKRLEVSTQP